MLLFFHRRHLQHLFNLSEKQGNRRFLQSHDGFGTIILIILIGREAYESMDFYNRIMKSIKEIDLKKAVSFVGTILMIIALVFVFRRLYQMREGLDFSILSNAWVLVALLLVVLLESITVILASINYRGIVVNISGVDLEFHVAIKVYNIANMYKFIPGGLLQVLGRNRMAVETEGLRHRKVALATLLEGILWVLAALILSIVYSFHYFMYYIRQLDALPLIGYILILILFITIPIFYRFRNPLQTTLKKINDDANGRLLMILIKYLIFMLAMISLWGLSFLATLTILGQPLTLGLGITIVGLYILSWLLGFLTPGAPSGLGIREFVLLMSLGGIIHEEILLSAIVIHRVLQIAGDIVAYVMAMCYAKIKKRENQ